MFGLCTVEKQFKSSDWYSSICSVCRFTIELIVRQVLACTKILREFSTTMTCLVLFLILQSRGLFIQLDKMLGVKAVVSDIVSCM